MRRQTKYLTIFAMIGILFFASDGCGTENSSKKPAQGPVYVTATPTPKPTKNPTPTSKPKDTPAPTYTAAPTKTPTPIPTAFEGGLAEYYKDLFNIGVATPNRVVQNNKYKDVLVSNFNQITPENETKPDALLNEYSSKKGLPETYTHAVVSFDRCKSIVDFCEDNGFQMRLHTLVWHSQTPAWFFTEDYTYHGKLVSREVMLQRMENYIKDVLDYFDKNHPGLIYAVDVCNEAFDSGNGDANGIRKVDNKWYETVGPDYYYQAFVYARKYAPDYMKLFYNDYSCAYKYDQMIKHLSKAKEEGLVDGIGMQSHLSITESVSGKYDLAMRAFLKAGYEVQVTELDIGMDELNDTNLNKQARKYKVLLNNVIDLKNKGYNITSVTFWGISDDLSWRTGKYPLLFDSSLNPKEAYYGVLQDPSIPTIE